MFASNAARSHLSPRHALAGLEAGVLGTILMLACLMAGSILNGRSVWVAPNLFATAFRGSAVYRNEFLNTSWAGVALLVAIYGGLGLIWGMVWRDSRRPSLALLGGVVGLVLYFLFFHLIWNRVDPLIPLYAPDRQLELGHILWGMALAKSPGFARKIADQTAESVVVEADEVIR
jgi:hypothetical protein